MVIQDLVRIVSKRFIVQPGRTDYTEMDGDVMVRCAKFVLQLLY